ncbi:MAG: substrate-binding domain-containing protein [Acidimicrobiales bacterium]
MTRPATRFVILRVLSAMVVAAACGVGDRGDGSVVKLSHAGSLAGVMSNPVNPKNFGAAFGVAAGYRLRASGAGSGALRDRIKSGAGAGARPDVFISADPAATASLDAPSSPGGPHWLSWWVNWARTEVVIGWSPLSPFAGAFEDAKAGRRTWESVLDPETGPAPKLGRTDPDVDPKGYRTLFTFQLDEARRVAGGEVAADGFRSRVLGAARCGLPSAPACPGGSPQIFDEATELVPRILNAQLDVGIFYTVEAIEAGIPYMALDPAINLGDPARTYSPDALGNPVRYCKSTSTCPSPMAYSTAGTIVYTVSVLQPNPAATNGPIAVNHEGAEAFVRFLLDGGQGILLNQGLLATPHVLSGSGGLAAVPESIKPLVA